MKSQGRMIRLARARGSWLGKTKKKRKRIWYQSGDKIKKKRKTSGEKSRKRGPIRSGYGGRPYAKRKSNGLEFQGRRKGGHSKSKRKEGGGTGVTTEKNRGMIRRRVSETDRKPVFGGSYHGRKSTLLVAVTGVYAEEG